MYLYSFHVRWKPQYDLVVFFNLMLMNYWFSSKISISRLLSINLLFMVCRTIFQISECFWFHCSAMQILYYFACIMYMILFGLIKSCLLYLLGLTSAGLQIFTYPVCIWLLEREGMESTSCYHHLWGACLFFYLYITLWMTFNNDLH